MEPLLFRARIFMQNRGPKIQMEVSFTTMFSSSRFGLTMFSFGPMLLGEYSPAVGGIAELRTGQNTIQYQLKGTF